MKTLFASLTLAILAFHFVACSSGSGSSSSGSTSSVKLPQLTPPMKKALPAGFGGTAHFDFAKPHMVERSLMGNNINPLASVTGQFLTALPVSNFQNRFFSAGPTDVLTILPSVDATIASINTQISSGTAQACVSQAGVGYTFTAPDGSTVNMVGQCYEMTNNNQFIEWGIDANNVFYLMEGGSRANLVESIAAIATPIAGSAGNYTVQVWLSVGNNNSTADASWDAGSYTVAELIGNSSTGSFEMTAAGMGIGFAGAQFISDGTDIFGEGSEDMGNSTSSIESVCVTAADITTTATSCTLTSSNFTLPALGRVATNGVAQANWAASHYPASPNTAINGTSSDATNFALSAPTAGVGQFTMQ